MLCVRGIVLIVLSSRLSLCVVVRDVSCSTCTYDNAHYRQSCEMCGTSLKSGNAHGMD